MQGTWIWISQGQHKKNQEQSNDKFSLSKVFLSVNHGRFELDECIYTLWAGQNQLLYL